MIQTLNTILLKPEGARHITHKTTKGGNKLNLNVNHHIGDHNYVKRIGIVESVPTIGTEVKSGDRVIVHHNVFRKYWDWSGKLTDGSSFFQDDLFVCYSDQVFAYKRGDSDWKSIEGSVFVSPVKNINDKSITTSRDLYTKNIGVLEILSDELIEEGYKVGDYVMFTDWSDYRFNIDGKLLYKMNNVNILCKIVDNGY